VAMAGGQLLFKAAALRLPSQGSVVEQALALLQSWHFATALAAYLALALLWVRILSFVPLSLAYPFVALAFAITPLCAALWFGEPLSARLLAGIIVVLCGLLLIGG
jgi:multidrug transporter EmrE-like cation transporter